MHKLKLKHFLLAASLSLGAQAAHAASLGALTVLSNIGQPLYAEIDIIPASEQELATVSAKLASADAFAEHGLQLSPELSALQFDVDTRPDGKPVLRLSTIEAITSPSIDLLIDLSWDGGSLVNKYAVPLEAAPAEDAEAEVALPALAEELPYQELTDEEIEADRQTEDVAIAEDLGELEEVLPAENMSEDAPPAAEVADTIQVAPAGAIAPVAESTAAALPDYTVESGDTLRNIAVQKSVDGTSLEQLMVGLYRANPHAFVKGDMNRLKTGVILHAPSTSEIKAINQADAEREVHMHAKNWNVYRNKLAGTVAKAEPAKDEQTAAQSVSGKIDSVQDQAAASGTRDVVKLSGADADNTGKAGKGKQSKSELEEELIARDKALQESNERIAMLEKQLQDAKKLLELRKPTALPEKGEPAKPAAAAPGQAWLTTVQEQLHKHPTWAPVGGIVAFVLLVLALLVRFFRKKEDAESAPVDIPPLSESMAAPVAVPMAAEVVPAPEPEPTPVPVAEDAAPVVPEPVAELAPSPVIESEQVPVFGSDAVLDLDDIAALMPETAPETPVVEEVVAELPEPEPEPEAEIPVSAVEAQDAVSLIAAMEEAAAAATEPEASAPVVAEEATQPAPAEDVGTFDVDDVFANEAAVAEQETAAPAEVEAAAPAAEMAVEEPTVEALAPAAGAMEAEPFDIDDVFAESAAPAVTEAVAEPEPAVEAAPQAEAAFDVEDVFDSEAALAEFAAEAAAHPAPTAEDVAAAALAEEEANDVMAMEAGDVEAEGQFALDDVFDEAATEAGETVSEAETQTEPPQPVEEVAAMPAEEPPTKVEAKTDDHSEALAAAFDESAVADLSDLDFGFDIDLGDVAAKTPAKPAVAEKVPVLDFSNINLNVGGAPAGDAAAASAEPPEVDTKLDLVTAYIDMSDEEGARELLQEVLKEGGPNQIARAQKLLESLG
jgi:pilus assembly protein FimV